MMMIIYRGLHSSLRSFNRGICYLFRCDNETMKSIFSKDPTAVEVQVANYVLGPFEYLNVIFILEERYSFEGIDAYPVFSDSLMDSGFLSGGLLLEDPED